MYLCYEAFMTIRQNGTLLLTLLNLMMHCNLMELNSEVDINHCRKCLGLDRPDHEVAAEFHEMFLASYKKQWMTILNWDFHRWRRAYLTRSSTS